MDQSRSRVHPGARFRKLLAERPTLALQGCFDSMSARLAELAGFEGLLLGGFAVEASLLGAPDIGMVTLTELAAHAARITDVVDIPIIADIDTGFGGINNVSRTIREMERAGLAGIHIEDQTTPKRCPALDGRTIVSLDEAVGRIQAALASRMNDDFVIIARSDSDAISFDELVSRCKHYLAAGADLVLPMLMSVNGRSISSFTPAEHMDLYAQLLRGIGGGPVMSVLIPEGYTTRDMQELGFRISCTPALTLEASVNAMFQVLKEARENGTAAEYFGKNPKTFRAGREIMEILKLNDYLAFEAQHDPNSPAARERRSN